MELHRKIQYGKTMEPLVILEERMLRVSPPQAEHDEAWMWNAFRAGSRDAFDQIFKQHASNLLAYGSRFSKDRDLVLDAIQDLFVELWNRRQALSETTSIKFYLLKALRLKIIRSVLGNKRFDVIAENARLLEDKINFSVEHFLVLRESEQFMKARLNRAIEGLSKRQREAVYLKFFQGLDNRAIASVMGLSDNSVNTLVSQAVRALREVLA